MVQTKFQSKKHQRAKLKRLRREKKRKLCPMIQHLEQELKGIGAEEAAQILINDFNLGLGTIKFVNSGTEITLDEVHQICKDKNIDARQVSPILFWGGSPNDSAREFKGSLLTLLFDRIMYEYCVTGAFADLVT
jgi:hypothetical protein